MARLTVTVLGDEQVSRNLLRMGELAENMDTPLREVADVVRERIVANFDAQGPGWAPLDEDTILTRAALGYGPGPILVRSGRMRASLTGESNEAITEIDGSSLAIGSSVPYAEFHQTGTANMPARPQVLPERVKRDAVKVLQRHLVETGRGDR